MNNIAVVNSTTPLKKDEDENFSDEYQKALLDRQFLTYPIILTTHVGLFDTFLEITENQRLAYVNMQIR